MFFGAISSRRSSGTCWRRQRLRRAMATELLAFSCPMMYLSSSATISRGVSVSRNRQGLEPSMLLVALSCGAMPGGAGKEESDTRAKLIRAAREAASPFMVCFYYCRYRVGSSPPWASGCIAEPGDSYPSRP